MIGVVTGAVLGGVAGFVIVKGACARCDDSAPYYGGAAIGMFAGGIIGGVASRRSLAASGLSRGTFFRSIPRSVPVLTLRVRL